MGQLIVFEGLDGSGKSTQMKRLQGYLSECGRSFQQIKLPDYADPSSTLVRMYLNGDFGNRPSDVNAYAASSFYAVDRYASYRRHWQSAYEAGALILADRYTTSNAVHQASKLDASEWDVYLDWLYDYEFRLLQIPKPDLVLYFDMLPVVSQKLLSGRYCRDETKKDIHERDVAYLQRCREAALYAARRLGWIVIRCDDGIQPKPIDVIFEQVLQHIQVLNDK